MYTAKALLISLAALALAQQDYDRRFARSALEESISALETEFGQDVDTSLEGYDHSLVAGRLFRRSKSDGDYSHGEGDDDSEDTFTIHKRSNGKVSVAEVAAAKRALGSGVDYSLAGMVDDDNDDEEDGEDTAILKQANGNVSPAELAAAKAALRSGVDYSLADMPYDTEGDDDDDEDMHQKRFASAEEVAAVKALLGDDIDYGWGELAGDDDDYVHERLRNGFANNQEPDLEDGPFEANDEEIGAEKRDMIGLGADVRKLLGQMEPQHHVTSEQRRRAVLAEEEFNAENALGDDVDYSMAGYDQDLVERDMEVYGERSAFNSKSSSDSLKRLSDRYSGRPQMERMKEKQAGLLASVVSTLRRWLVG